MLALTFRPDGVQLAVASLDAQITFWDIARRVLFLLRSVLRNTQGSCVYWFRGVGEYLACVTVNRLIVVSRGRKKRIFELSGSAIPSLAAFLVPRIGVLYSSGLQSSGHVFDALLSGIEAALIVFISRVPNNVVLSSPFPCGLM